MSSTQLSLTATPGIGYGYIFANKQGPSDEVVFLTDAPLYISRGSNFVYLPEANAHHFSLSGAPSDMTFDAETGLIEWFPGAGVATSGQLTLTAFSEDETESDIQVFTLTVRTKPKIISTAPYAATNGQQFVHQPVAEDEENNIVAGAWTVSGAPAGMTIDDDSGEIVWTPSSTGSYTFIVRVTDSTGLFSNQLITLMVS